MRYNKLLVLALVVFSFACKDNVTEPVVFGSGDDYAIYKTVLQDYSTDQQRILVLNDSTESQTGVSENPDYFLNQIEGLSPETLLSYSVRNQQRIKLKKIANLNFIFASETGNISGDKKYATVSRIGYDGSKSQAVVTIGIVYGPLAGNGYLIFLVKNGDTWEIKSRIMTWIS